MVSGATKPCAVSWSWTPAQESSTCYISTEPPSEPALVRPQPTACQQHWPSLGTNPNMQMPYASAGLALARSPSWSVGSGWGPSESLRAGGAQTGPSEHSFGPPPLLVYHSQAAIFQHWVEERAWHLSSSGLRPCLASYNWWGAVYNFQTEKCLICVCWKPTINKSEEMFLRSCMELGRWPSARIGCFIWVPSSKKISCPCCMIKSLPCLWISPVTQQEPDLLHQWLPTGILRSHCVWHPQDRLPSTLILPQSLPCFLGITGKQCLSSSLFFFYPISERLQLLAIHVFLIRCLQSENAVCTTESSH